MSFTSNIFKDSLILFMSHLVISKKLSHVEKEEEREGSEGKEENKKREKSNIH